MLQVAQNLKSYWVLGSKGSLAATTEDRAG